MKREERVQHKYLMWLAAGCEPVAPLEYDALLSHFGMPSVAAWREQHDIMFIRNVHCQAVDSPYLLERLPLAVPSRPLRNRMLFHVPHARVNTVLNNPFCRMPKLCIWTKIAVLTCGSKIFKNHVIAYLRERQVG